MREARYVSLIPRTTLHSDSEQLHAETGCIITGWCFFKYDKKGAAKEKQTRNTWVKLLLAPATLVLWQAEERMRVCDIYGIYVYALIYGYIKCYLRVRYTS
jgi:hypothetical protein